MRYCCELDRYETHRLRFEECHTYWVIYDRQRGYRYPLAFVEEAVDANKIVDALNSRE